MWHEALCLFAQLRCASNPSCQNRIQPLPARPLTPLCAVPARNFAEPLQLRYANNSLSLSPAAHPPRAQY